ncbi:MAG TPA: hypothetical protein DCZ08_03520 [Anaerolineaceae bacterium]|nr:hypothetical protein [Anaerolineaceae bacterium]
MRVNELFSEAAKIVQLNVEVALAAASYPASGAFIDVSQFERFAFLVEAGVLDSEITCQVQQAATINGALKNVTDAVVVIAATGDSKWYLIEVQTARLDINNGYNYVTLTLTGPAGINDFGAITFFGLNGPAPATQGADKGAVVVVAG